MNRPRFGYLRVHVMLRREGWAINKKRVWRLYRLDGLQLRMKTKRRKRISLQRGHVLPATGPNEHWSMDFVHDQMLDGRKFRILTVIDQWSRESVSLEPGFSLTGRCVGHALDQAAIARGMPRAITVDNGTEFTSKALDEWAYRRGVKTRLHAAWKAHRQRADRVVQRKAARRVPEHPRVRHDARRP